ncbi:MAG: Fe-S biogenesis protein NfuA [Cellvibrionaceae bacterium]
MTDTSANISVNVEFTESAQEYLAELLEKQDCEGIGIRMFVSDPGTPKAETCIAYCRPGEENEEDVIVELTHFKAHFEGRSLPFLEDAKVDYSKDKFGGQLTIRAPNSKMPQVNDDSPLEDRINYVLYNEVNPGLASHGGKVSLTEITEDKFAILEFGGGCQGCSAVDVTLKDGVEKTLIERIPELTGVRDVTDHSDKSQAYFK